MATGWGLVRLDILDPNATLVSRGWSVLSNSRSTKQTWAVKDCVNFEALLLCPTALVSQFVHSPGKFTNTHKTNGPSPLHKPSPDMLFISWNTCRRAKDWRNSYPLLSMLCLGSFHPPADRRVYMWPLVKDPRRSCLVFFTSAPPLSLRLGGDQTHRANRTESYDGLCVRVHDSVTVITVLNYPSPWAPQIQRSTSNPNISSRGACVTVRYYNLAGKRITPTPELNNSLPPFLL